MIKQSTVAVIFFWLLQLFILKVSGQPYFDIANVYYQQSPDNSLYHSDETPVKTEAAAARLKAAFKIKKDLLIVNPYFEYYKFKISESPEQKLYNTGLALTYLKQWKDEKWSTAFVAVPRISSDFKNIDENDYQLGGAVLGIYKKSETLVYKLGIYYNSEFFGPFVTPLVGIEWKPNPRLRIFGVIPNYFNVEYKFSKTFYTGFESNFILNSFRFEDNSFLRVDDNHLKIYFDTYVTKNIVINLQIGQSVTRRYRTGTRENGTTNYTNLNVNDGLLLRAGFFYRLRLDENKEPGK
jgi:hypothetical protein